MYAWAIDPGCGRILQVLANRLRSLQSPAIVLSDAFTISLEVRLEASDAVATVPPTLGQLYLGAQAVLTKQAVGDEMRFRDLLAGQEEAAVGEIVDAVALHYGVPLSLLTTVTSADSETWKIGETTGLERFGPVSQPTRGNAAPEEEAVAAENPDAAAAAGREPRHGGPGQIMNQDDDHDDDEGLDDAYDEDDYVGEEE